MDSDRRLQARRDVGVNGEYRSLYPPRRRGGPEAPQSILGGEAALLITAAERGRLVSRFDIQHIIRNAVSEEAPDFPGKFSAVL